MKKKTFWLRMLAVILANLLVVPTGAFAQDATTPAPATQDAAAQGATASPAFKQEELDQLLAPIALYPDSLVSQILMASTYPLEVVQAQRWAQENKSLTGDALAKALEAQPWDPSVKSLVNFPQVLDMMNTKLEWTQKLGDAFLAQQKDVMATTQKLRQKAQTQGNLKTTTEQKIIVEKETQTIIIESADPKVVYVPVYNPTVVYGVWWWPHYPPPYYYYPPGYVATGVAFSFAAGVAVGAAWSHAYGHCDWHGGEVNINRNTTINNNVNNSVNRNNSATQYNKSGQAGTTSWQHDPSHRKGVSYRDQGTAQKYNKASTNQAAKSREAYRGYADQGRQELARGSADQFKGQKPSTMNQGRATDSKFSSGSSNMKSSGSSQRASASTSNMKSGGSSGSSAFSGIDKGSSTKQASSRGQSSLNSMRSGASSSRSSGSFSGGGRRR